MTHIQSIDPYLTRLIRLLEGGEAVTLTIADFRGSVFDEVRLEKEHLFVERRGDLLVLAGFGTRDERNVFFWMPNYVRDSGMIPATLRTRYFKGRFRRIKALVDPPSFLLE